MDNLSDFKRLALHKLDNILTVQNASLASENVPTQFNVLVITSFGHIEAEYFDVFDGKEGNDLGVSTLSTAISLTKNDNPPVVTLKNAKITLFGQKEPSHVIEQMLLFTDQIVGLSFK